MQPGKEKPTGEGGLLRTDYEAETVADSYLARQQRMDREYLAACRAAGIQPDLAGRVCSQEFAALPAQAEGGLENGASVPATPPPVEKVQLTAEQLLLRTISHACSWSDGNPVRWTAFLVCAGYDTRAPGDVAKSLCVSPRLLQMRVKEARAWLEELRTELEAA